MFDIYRTQDIQLDDVSLKAQYYKEFMQGNVTNAQSIYTQNPQLQGKVINADMLNKLINGVLGLEGLYNTDVTQDLINKLNELQININELIYMQDFSPTTQYDINNFVVYNELIYYCIAKPFVNTLPTNGNYWLELGLKGDQGEPTLGVTYLGIWSNSTQYSKFDMVVFDNDLYVAKMSNKNISTSDTNTWFKAVDMIPQVIYVSKIEPSGITNGDIWWKIL